jgi:hypothetical protein
MFGEAEEWLSWVLDGYSQRPEADNGEQTRLYILDMIQ